jgi:hypothetical protein
VGLGLGPPACYVLSRAPGTLEGIPDSFFRVSDWGDLSPSVRDLLVCCYKACQRFLHALHASFGIEEPPAVLEVIAANWGKDTEHRQIIKTCIAGMQKTMNSASLLPPSSTSHLDRFRLVHMERPTCAIPIVKMFLDTFFLHDFDAVSSWGSIIH